jgi:hypothetical protein
MSTDLSSLGSPSIEGIPAFMGALERLRAALPPRDWRTLIRSNPDIRSWRYFLALDPYTRWGLLKPRGYAGDARLMDFAYRHAGVMPDVSLAGSVGAAIYEYTSSAAQSQSARERIAFIRQTITAVTKQAPQRVTSFASGFARELESLAETEVTRITEFVAIDADDLALSEVRRMAGAISCKLVHRNVVADVTSDLAQSGLVYSLGLFDYLQADAAESVLRKMLRLTATPGLCVVANLSHEAANLGYCEGIMDWWMVTRSAEDLLALAQAAVRREGYEADIETLRVGCFHVLLIRPALLERIPPPSHDGHGSVEPSRGPAPAGEQCRSLSAREP